MIRRRTPPACLDAREASKLWLVWLPVVWLGCAVEMGPFEPPPGEVPEGEDEGVTPVRKLDARAASDTVPGAGGEDVPPARPPADAGAVVDASESEAGSTSTDAQPGVDGQADPTPSSTPALGSVGLGPFATCLIDPEHKLHCFGRPVNGDPPISRTRPPQNLGKVLAVAGHHVAVCAILRDPPAPDEAIRCWGYGIGGQRPPRVDRPTQITSGERHSCVTARDGAVTCWGENAAAHRPPAGLKAKRIASLTFNCAIDLEDRVVCWGPGAVQPPAGLRAKRIDVGGHYSGSSAIACAVSMADEVVCWGTNGGAVLDPPAGLKAKEVDVGHGWACAADLDDAIRCWGAQRGVMPPAGARVRHLFLNYVSAVGVTAEGGLVFWGDAGDGRHRPPIQRVLMP